MGNNWTQTLTDRNNGRRAGFGLPADLEDLDGRALADEARRRGINPEHATTADELRDAIAGRVNLTAPEAEPENLSNDHERREDPTEQARREAEQARRGGGFLGARRGV